MANGVTLLLLGPPGVGKSHLAVALRREAVRLGHSVQYLGAMELISALAKAQAQHALEARLTQYANTRLLIGVWLSGGRHHDPGSPAAPQPRADDPRRQLPAKGEAAQRPDPPADGRFLLSEQHWPRPPPPAEEA